MSGKVYAVPTRHRRLDIVAPMSVIKSWDGFYLIGFRGSTGRQVKHEPSIYPICQTEAEAEGYLRGAAAVCGWEPWPENVEKKSYTRAEELEARMEKRLAELEKEKQISAMPPVIVGGSIVIPRGLLNSIMGRDELFPADADSRRQIELVAMKAVMDIEISLGFIPIDVSGAKVGYDVESQTPRSMNGTDGSTLRFIEVKGRVKGADTVTVTKNEILTAFNKPDQYILAIVEVEGNDTRTVYLKKPFRERPDFAATSVNYNIGELVGVSEIILRG